MSINKNNLTEDQANAIYDVLVSAAGASERNRDMFVHNQTTSFCDEWRFGGDFGFGGKFWRTPRSNGETWTINAYTETYTDELKEREIMINRILNRLQAGFAAADAANEFVDTIDRIATFQVAALDNPYKAW